MLAQASVAGVGSTAPLARKIFDSEYLMRKNLALLAFEEGEGPWIRAKGNESGAQVRGLVDGEELCMEIEGLYGGLHLREGTNRITLRSGQMYRFVKKVSEGQKPSKTCVEVILNGQASS